MRTVISLGGGVQSTLMVLSLTEKYYDERIAKHFEDPVVIMADTGSEKPETMEYVKKIIFPELEKSNIEHHLTTSKHGKLHEYYLENEIIPFRTYRQCTEKFKARPIRDLIQKLGVYKKRGDKINLALGITTDEIQRMKPNVTTWIDNIFPLIEANFSRQDCIDWYEKNNLPVPIKSGCFCCPFQRKNEWIENFKKHPELVELSIKMETTALNKNGNPNDSNYKLSLYRDNMTLKELIDYQRDQTSLDAFFEDYSTDDECSANCFL